MTCPNQPSKITLRVLCFSFTHTPICFSSSPSHDKTQDPSDPHRRRLAFSLRPNPSPSPPRLSRPEPPFPSDNRDWVFFFSDPTPHSDKNVPSPHLSQQHKTHTKNSRNEHTKKFKLPLAINSYISDLIDPVPYCRFRHQQKEVLISNSSASLTISTRSPFSLCNSHSMPLKWVLHWQPNAGTTVNSQILNEVSQCVETFNGVKEGRWKATLTYYKPLLRDQSLAAEFPRDFLGISLPEQPSKYYFIIRGQRIVLEADATIQTIMEKLQSYKSRVALYFEGFQYQLGDFQLRVGKVTPTHSENLRGIVMEVEYLPLSSMEKSRQVMEEFVDIWQEAITKRSLPGHFMHIEPSFAEYGLSDNYSSQHTAVQYANVTAQLIATQSVQAVRN